VNYLSRADLIWPDGTFTSASGYSRLYENFFRISCDFDNNSVSPVLLSQGARKSGLYCEII
jgi:hypothetical protein